MTKNKIVVFIDSFQEKNRLQYDLMNEFGYESVWFQTAVSVKEDIQTIVVLRKGLFPRLYQLIIFFSKNKSNLHHTELYPGGRFAFLIMLISKLAGVPVLCCERGDIYNLVYKKVDFLTRTSQFMVYKFANYMWLRELFAEDYLKKINIHRDHFFIHNVVPIPTIEKLPTYSERDIDFLWVNSLKSFRRVDWFDDALEQAYFSATKNVLLGVTDHALKNEYSHIDAKKNLEVNGFISPKEFYKRAKFFVMPASIVYLNHALLEAMSYGVVPLITDAQGASLIIQNGVDGFICPYEKEAFVNLMKNALVMTEVDFNNMSIQAREKIISDYSATYYKTGLKKMYDSIL